MKRSTARRQFVSEWMLEFSVLWAVFPLLDQLLSGRVDYGILALAWALFMISFLVGIALVGKEDR